MTAQEVRKCFYRCIDELHDHCEKWLQDGITTKESILIMELEDSLACWMEYIGNSNRGIIGNNTYLAVKIKDDYYDDICKMGILPNHYHQQISNI
jgi:hypothetical protein